ncbi:MAG: nucleoside triphosphate pyrophosphohydrolase [Oscillospiraceae bacterium]|nr:nucleoside triphosphate pyrophosphohydrolase [Oscillospiraceae bacterium]
MVNFLSKDKYVFEDLIEITKILRSDGGCPWDREQTHKSVRMNFVEEVFEACEAIDNDNPELLLEELGDVLAQVVFHAQIENEIGRFDINDVADGVCKKFIERHPHVFGEVSAETSDEVLKNWDEIKRREKKQTTHFSAMDSVARSLPALMRAEKLQSKAKKAGLPQKNVLSLSELIEEELSKGEEMNIGNVLFLAVSLARRLGVNPEQELDLRNEEFLHNFKKLENEKGELSQLLSENQDKL